MSHLGVLKNRSSADPEVIEGGKDRGGERNGVAVYGVMPPFSLMPRPLLEKSRSGLVTQLTIAVSQQSHNHMLMLYAWSKLKVCVVARFV